MLKKNDTNIPHPTCNAQWTSLIINDFHWFSLIFINFDHFAEYDHIWRSRRHRTDQIMLKNIKNYIQTVSNASETCVFEGKTSPGNSRWVYPSWSHYEISWISWNLQNPSKSMKINENQWKPLIIKDIYWSLQVNDATFV